MDKKEMAWKYVKQQTDPIIEEAVQLVSSVDMLGPHVDRILDTVAKEDFYSLGYQEKLIGCLEDAEKEVKEIQAAFDDDKPFQAEIQARIEVLKSVKNTINNKYDEIRGIITELRTVHYILENSKIDKEVPEEKENA